jgi:lysozyme
MSRILKVLLLGSSAFLLGGALYWFGLWIPNFPSSVAYPVRGIDVSHHQGVIDWRVAKRSRIDFAYIKATEGRDFTDPQFSRNWTQSGEADVVRGAYHFFTFGTPALRQAENFIATVPLDKTALPPAIDLELSGNNNEQRAPARDELQREIKVFVSKVGDFYGKTPVVYTTPDFAARYLAGVSIDRLWTREILVRPSDKSAWLFWQFSERGKVPGISGYVDLDVFKGDVTQLETLRGLH